MSLDLERKSVSGLCMMQPGSRLSPAMNNILVIGFLRPVQKIIVNQSVTKFVALPHIIKLGECPPDWAATLVLVYRCMDEVE